MLSLSVCYYYLWSKSIADLLVLIVVATIFAYNQIILFHESFIYLPGSISSPDYMSGMENLTRLVPWVADVQDLHTELVGLDVFRARSRIVVPGN